MEYTLAECLTHKSAKDCWIVIDNKVYDVTNYLDEHPGGGDLILSIGGRDATAEYVDAGHSLRADAVLSTFCIGACTDSATAPKHAPVLALDAATPRQSLLGRISAAVFKYLAWQTR
jgi:cytochrome b5